MVLVLKHPDDAWVEVTKDLPVRVGCEDPSELEQLEESVEVDSSLKKAKFAQVGGW